MEGFKSKIMQDHDEIWAVGLNMEDESLIYLEVGKEIYFSEFGRANQEKLQPSFKLLFACEQKQS